MNVARPIYETKEHLQAEKAFASEIEKRKGILLSKLPYYYKADYVISKNDAIIGVAELKVRNIQYQGLPTVMVSLHKFMHCAALASEVAALIGKPAMLVLFFRFLDGDIYYKVANDEGLSLVCGGRTAQTRDEEDLEPMVHIPTHLFKIL